MPKLPNLLESTPYYFWPNKAQFKIFFGKFNCRILKLTLITSCAFEFFIYEIIMIKVG